MLPRFIAFYGALFAALGVASPFLPRLLLQDGLQAAQLGVVLAAGNAIRLLAGPLGGRLAARPGRAPLVLAGFTAIAALVVVAHAAVLAPLTPVADALALGSSQDGAGFKYGWVRGAGSAAFIAGTLLSGQLVGPMGLGVIIWLNAGLLAMAAALGWLLPNRVAGGQAASDRIEKGAVSTLLRIPAFAWLLAVAALVGGSHALHDGFEVIRWHDAGLSPEQSSVLWGLSVASEVVVFVIIGPRLLDRLGPANAMVLSAAAGIVRWGTAGQTAWFPAMLLVEPLHGLTFALLHLACMNVIERVVPSQLAATAQAFYATVGIGLSTTAITLVSGPLYAGLGGKSFWFMAGLCALAVPVAARLRTALHAALRTAGNSGPGLTGRHGRAEA